MIGRASLSILAAVAVSACGWTNYQFVADDVTIVDAGDDLATDVAQQDDGDASVDDSDADAGPLFRWANLMVETRSLGPTSSTYTASFIEEPPSSAISAHVEVYASCSVVQHGYGLLANDGGGPSGVDVGTLTFTNNDGGVRLLSYTSGGYPAPTDTPQTWANTDTISITWPGMGDEPMGAYQVALANPPEAIALPNDAGVATVDHTQALTVQWVTATNPVLIWIAQRLPRGSVDILCAEPAGSSQVIVPSLAMTSLVPGTSATLLWGGGHSQIITSRGPPGLIMLVGIAVGHVESLAVQ